MATPTGLPVAQIFFNAGGRTGGTIMWFFVMLVQFFTGCSAMLANARMAWAFSRDAAFPFSGYVFLPSTPHNERINADPSQLLEQSKHPHSNPRERRLARRRLLQLSRPNRYRQHTNHNRHLQHHRTSARHLLHCRHHRAPVVRRPRRLPRRTVHNGRMEQARERRRGNVGHFHQHGAVLPDSKSRHAFQHELRHLRRGLHRAVQHSVVVCWRTQELHWSAHERHHRRAAARGY